MLKEILEHNRHFVEMELYKPYITERYPQKKVAIVTCMDTRLIELLPAAIGIQNGDIKIIKNAGGIISHPYGSVMRSLIVAIYDLYVDTVWVIGHTDCGMENLDVRRLIEKMKSNGITDETIESVAESGVDFEKWLGGFESAECAVLDSVDKIRHHPLIPEHIKVEGLLIDSVTGELSVVNPQCLSLRGSSCVIPR